MWAAISYRNELHHVPARVWLGTKHEYVHGAPILFLYTYTTYVGVCERYKPRKMACAFVSVFCFGGIDFVNVFVGICANDVSN